MLIRIYAAVLGTLLAAMGVVGFYPELSSNGKILGLFSANKLDNLCHLIVGIVAIFCGIQSTNASKVLSIAVGIVSAAFALFGFIQGPGVYYGMTIGGLPDLWLLTGISVVSLYFGFFLKKK